jgi:hypothetical protein
MSTVHVVSRDSGGEEEEEREEKLPGAVAV